VRQEGHERYVRNRFHGAPATPQDRQAAANGSTAQPMTLEELKRRAGPSVP